MTRIGLTMGDPLGIISDVEGYRVLLDGREVRVDTQICQPGGAQFQRADSLIELSGKLTTADPWSAWENMESAAPWEEEQDSREDSEEDFEEETQLDAAPITLPRSLPLVLEPVLSEQDLAPLDAPTSAEPEPESEPEEPPGKVIAFPGSRPRRTVSDGGYALDERPLHHLPPPPLPELQFPERARKPPRHTATLSFMRLASLVGLGVVVLLLARAYVVDTAGTVLPPHPAVAAQGGGEVPAEPAVDPYAMMESQLRAQMSLDLMEAPSEAIFEEALLIELGRVKLDVASVRVTVGEWAGRKRDVPQSAEFRIKLRFRSGELDRELAGIGLVVGKYIQRYSLEVTHFEVIIEHPDGEAFRYRIDPEAARKFYIQRISLREFLEAQ